MPNWLSFASTSQLNPSNSRDSRQEPKLPFEILYAVLDELLAGLAEGDKRPEIKTIASTCRAFEAYVRVLRYANLRLRASYTREDGSSTRSFPEPFMEIVRQRPNLLELVQSLSLCFGQSISSDPAYPIKKNSRFLGAIGMNHPSSRWKEWAGVLTARFPQLTSLTLHFDWAKVPPDTREAILAMLLNLKVLEHLRVDSPNLPIDLLRSLPSKVKQLAWVRDGANEHSTHVTISAQPPARDPIPLEALSLFYSASERDMDERFLFQGSGPVDFTSLKHFRFGPVSFVTTLVTNLAFAQEASSTLQCLHIGFHRFILPHIASEQAALQIINFPALSVLEITVGRQGLPRCLQWISNSIATIHLAQREERLSSLQIPTARTKTIGGLSPQMLGRVYGQRISLGFQVAMHGTDVVAALVSMGSGTTIFPDIWDRLIEMDKPALAAYHIPLYGSLVPAQAGGLKGCLPCDRSCNEQNGFLRPACEYPRKLKLQELYTILARLTSRIAWHDVTVEDAGVEVSRAQAGGFDATPL
ncbi:hypothetical protein BKA70DRAFT_1418419 [Coprinopsis sp. MPI-PUGE-AT-0042]|nr:hypothetical protein BKA70DRAFT_1418419 [Coprinopsis sp. MPI-PUGE-AT-0042]